MSISVDTISIAERLQASGVKEPVARAFAKEFSHNSDQAATKADVHLLHREMGMLRWMVGICITLVTVCTTVTIAILILLVNAS